MADRVGLRGSVDLNFIDSNPAMDAYEHGQKIARENESADLVNESRRLQNETHRAEAPTKLRRLNADTSTAETAATVAQQTAPAHIAQPFIANRTADAGARVAEATVPAHISEANSAASTAASGARVAVATEPNKIADSANESRLKKVSANVAEGTQGAHIEAPKIANRNAAANAQNAELTSFYKEIELLNAGNIDGAQQVAAAAGHTLPPEIVSNADARAAITRAAKHAQELYPNRPKDQLAFIQGFIKDMGDRRAKGQPATAPEAPYQVPGAPEPPEDTSRDSFDIVYRQEPDPTDPSKMITRAYNHSKTTGELTAIDGNGAFTRAGGPGAGGGTGGRTSVFQQKQQAWLTVHPNDNEGALAYASGHRQMGDGDIIKSSLTMAQREIANNTMLKFKNPAEQAAAVNKRAAEIAAQLKAGYAPPAAPAPAPAPMQPPPGLSGNGTQQAPFQATTQDHVNWFKANAQPGQVIMINGAPFTK